MERNKPQLAKSKDCTGCLVCVDSCHQDALTSYIGSDGHYYVNVKNDRCIGCLQCERTCPLVSKQDYDQSELSVFHAAWNKNSEERAQSASGGAFSAMARFVLERGGLVVGAATENVCDVRHIVISDITELSKLQGSKYTQSDTRGIFQKTYQLLKDGREVLFSGTGCQVGALLSFLKNRKYHGNLITVDLICGGVPSKLLLQNFIENEPYRIKRIISYRTKENGWKPMGFKYNLKVEGEDGTIHDYTGINNVVTTAFSTELTERYSCYDCRFVGKHRRSDFTIGDLWGDKMYPQEHYNGVSLVISHNHKAEALLEDMSDYLQVMPCDEDQATEVNFRLVNGHSSKQYLPERRYLEILFSHFSYKTLKKIYANDYENYSPWVIFKIIRKLSLLTMNLMK